MLQSPWARGDDVVEAGDKNDVGYDASGSDSAPGTCDTEIMMICPRVAVPLNQWVSRPEGDTHQGCFRF